MNLSQLRAALKDKSGQIATLKAAAEAEGAGDDAFTALDVALKEIDTLETRIKQMEDAERRIKAAATPIEPSAPAAQPIEKLTAGQKLGLGITAMVRANRLDGQKGSRAVAKALDDMGYGAIADELGMTKALNSGAGSAGGFAVPEGFNEELFRELQPYAAFLRGGPEIVPMPEGNYVQAGASARPAVGYRGEGSVIAAAQPTLREFTMAAKHLGGIVPITNQLIKYTANRASQLAQGTLLSSMGLAMDAAAFLGSGAGNNPLGVLSLPGITTFVAANSVTPTAAQVDADARKLINVVAQYALLQMSVKWVMTQRVKGYLEDMRDTNGNPFYPSLSGDNPTFKGYPVLLTGSIPNNGGAGTNESTIALVAFGQVLMGETGGLQVAVSEEATFDSGGGVMVSAFANDLTLIRATMSHDFNARYVEAVGTLTAVKWGA